MAQVSVKMQKLLKKRQGSSGELIEVLQGIYYLPKEA